MAYEYDDLKHKTVVELRDIAAGIGDPAVQGYTQMNKEHLLKAICTVLKIDMHHHAHVVGIDKTAIKKRIRELKTQRDAAIEAHDSAQLKTIRRHIHRMKRELHKAAV